MTTLIGALRVTLGLDSAAFEKGASAVEKRAKGMVRTVEAHGKAMTDLGKTMSVAVTAPLVAFGVKSVQAAMESRDAMGQVEAALASMGSAAGRTSDQLAAMAGNLMHNSLYDDDDILRKVTANLLTFGNVAGEQFDRAQQAAVDLAARMGMDLQGATLLVGKALNDPIKGMGALRKAGIQLTEQQQQQIKAMVAVGNAAGAQKVLLSELEKQFGGSAAAAQKANPFDTLKDSAADFMEAVGGQLLEILPNVTAALTKVIDAFGALSPAMQQGVVYGGLLATALGPVLTIMGAITTATAPFTGTLAAIASEQGVLAAARAGFIGLGAAIGPMLAPLAAVGAAGYIIYQNWDKIGPVVSDLWASMQAALGPPLQALISNLTATLTELWNGPLGESLRQVIGLIGDLVVWQVKAFGPVFIALLRSVVDVAGGVLSAIGDALKAVSRLLQGDWAGAWEAAKSAAVNAFKAINAVFLGLPGFVADVLMRMVGAVNEWIGGKLNAIWESAAHKIEWVKQQFYDLYDAVVGHSYIPDMVDGIAAQMLRLDGVMVDKAEAATAKTKAAFQKLAEELQPLMARLFPEAVALNEYRDNQKTLDAALNSKDPRVKLSQSQYDEAKRRLHLDGAGLDPTAPLGPSAIEGITSGPIVVDIDKINAGLDRLRETTTGTSGQVGVATVRIAQSFKDMADATLNSLQNMASAIKGGGFLDILGAVIGLGLQIGSVGAFGKGLQTRLNSTPNTTPTIPQYANGTNFHPGGWAVVGERGPEMVHLPRGSAVTPNERLGGSVTNNFTGNLLTPEFWAQINTGHAVAAQAGGELGYRKVVSKGRRRLA
jgi:hypothetical protein